MRKTRIMMNTITIVSMLKSVILAISGLPKYVVSYNSVVYNDEDDKY